MQTDGPQFNACFRFWKHTQKKKQQYCEFHHLVTYNWFPICR